MKTYSCAKAEAPVVAAKPSGLTYEQALKEEGIYRSVAAGSSFRLIVVGYGKSAVGLYHYQGSLEIAQGIKTSLFERTTETLCLEIR